MSSELPDWAQGLGLEPHPEGGWYAETWRSTTVVDGDVLGGYPGPRSLATAILFLLMPGQESAWHRVRSAELWFHHAVPRWSWPSAAPGRRPLRCSGSGSDPMSLRENGLSWWCHRAIGSRRARWVTSRCWSAVW